MDFKIYTCFWQIGIYLFIIHSSKKDLKCPFHKIPNDVNETIIIHIWIEESIILKQKVITFCQEKAHKYIPEELKLFYTSINQQLRKILCIFRTC